MAPGQRLDLFLVPRVDELHGHATGAVHLRLDLFRSLDVVVGEHELLDPGPVFAQDGHRFADSSYTHQENLHVWLLDSLTVLERLRLT